MKHCFYCMCWKALTPGTPPKPFTTHKKKITNIWGFNCDIYRILSFLFVAAVSITCGDGTQATPHVVFQVFAKDMIGRLFVRGYGPLHVFILDIYRYAIFVAVAVAAAGHVCESSLKKKLVNQSRWVHKKQRPGSLEIGKSCCNPCLAHFHSLPPAMVQAISCSPPRRA